MNKLYTFGLSKSLFRRRNIKPYFLAHRKILSNAYLCEEAWEKRLEGPTLRNIKLDQYFVETDKKFGTKQLVSGIDIDLFANAIKDESQLDELEHLLYRFRRTKRAVEIMDSTVYAIVHIYLKLQHFESLLRILNDRENYGIFPDFCSYNKLMSTFLKNKMYRDSANIAILMMLQENFENKLSCLLGLYSCQKFIDECTFDSLKEIETVPEETKEDDDDDEEILVRVPFIQNPWFDDHFEITNPKHLIGKTFYLIGRELKNPLGRSYQLLGLAMYEKWEKALNLLQSFITSEDSTILKDTIEKIKSQIETIPEDENKSRENWADQFEKCFNEMASKQKLIEGTFTNALANMLKDLPEYEKKDIEEQIKLFSDWEVERQEAIKKQEHELDRQRRLKAIEEKKEYLLWKERLLFFFENEEKNLEELKKVEELVESLQQKAETKDTYFPPEIIRKAPERLTKYQRLARVKKV